MCNACPQARTVVYGRSSLRVERVWDDFTHPRDYDAQYGPQEVEAFENREWFFVGLRATVYCGGEEVGTEAVFGVAEGAGTPCAYERVDVVRAVTRDALAATRV